MCFGGGSAAPSPFAGKSVHNSIFLWIFVDLNRASGTIFFENYLSLRFQVAISLF